MKKVKITPEQYNKLFSHVQTLNEKYNRIDKVFLRQFGMNEEELNKPNLKGALTGVPDSKMRPEKTIKLPSSMNESSNKGLHKAINKLITSLWLNDDELDVTFDEMGLSKEDLISYLESVGIVGKTAAGVIKVKNYFHRNFSSDPEEMEKEKHEEIEKMTDKIANDPKAPWNKNKPEEKKVTSEDEENFYKQEKVKAPKELYNPITMNDEIALFNGPDGVYVFNYDEMNIPDAKNIQDITNYLNSNPEISKGEGLADFEQGYPLVKLDEPLKQELRDLYTKNADFIKDLNKLQEITGAASSGAFVGPMGAAPSRKNITKGYTPAEQINKLISDEEQLSKNDEGTIEEMTTAGGNASMVNSPSGQYVQPKIWAKDKKNWVGNKKTQYPHGQMVTFDDCTKLNNNKEAQRGGCSQGAVDNVVKLSGRKQSVISKTMYEAVAKQSNKTVEEVQKIIENKLHNDPEFRLQVVAKETGRTIEEVKKLVESHLPK